jgi:hypothetical protein
LALFIADATRFNSGVANLRIQPVQSLDAPELALYLTLRRVEEHERAGVLVATNIKVVKRLLASRYTVVSALLTPAWLEQLEPLLRARPEAEICVYVGERKLLETITGYQLHQGALAVAKIPPQPDFETLLNNVSRPMLLAAVEGIASAENLGAVVRNCAAFGAHFLIVGETCGSPFQRRAVSGSMAGRAVSGGASPARGQEAGRRGFAGRLLPGVWRGRTGPHGGRAGGVRRPGGNPDAFPHEFPERGRRHGNIPLRSDPAARLSLIYSINHGWIRMNTDRKSISAMQTSSPISDWPSGFAEAIFCLVFNPCSSVV